MRNRIDKMPFGKYKNRPIASLPNWYLTWLADLPDLRDPLLSAVQDELERRRDEEPEPERPTRGDDACPDPGLAED